MSKDIKNQNLESTKLRTSNISKNKRDKKLPWWVELLFVQIGLPDKFLINFLKANKNSRDFFKKEKKIILVFLLVFTGIAYFYPIIKFAKNNLDCLDTTKKYIVENATKTKFTRKELNMLSTNFCNGAQEIYEIKN